VDNHAALVRKFVQATVRPVATIRPFRALRHDEGVAGPRCDRPRCRRGREEAEEDLLAFYPFLPDHWTKLRSTNPLKRFNREIGRRTDVVGIFPNDRALIRLAASIVIEQNDERLVGRRYLRAHSLDAALGQDKDDNDRRDAHELAAA